MIKNLKLKITLILAIYLAIYGIGFCLADKLSFGIRINHTASLPYKVFLSAPFNTVKRYAHVSFYHPHTSKSLAKRIIGLPGDQISCCENHVYVNDYDCGHAFNMTSSGSPLIPIETGIIPEGYVFVHAPHPDSFDSRYLQFGLIPISLLEETLWPIF